MCDERATCSSGRQRESDIPLTSSRRPEFRRWAGAGLLVVVAFVAAVSAAVAQTAASPRGTAADVNYGPLKRVGVKASSATIQGNILTVTVTVKRRTEVRLAIVRGDDLRAWAKRTLRKGSHKFSGPVRGATRGTNLQLRVTARLVGTNKRGRERRKIRRKAQPVANHAPTDVTLSPSTIDENRPAATLVGSLSAADPDAGQAHSFALVAGAGSADNALFAISAGQLVTAAPLNFEAKPTASVRVRATDSKGATFEKALTVTIANVNEAPGDLALSKTSVDENQPAGTTVGSLTSSDPDAGAAQTYSLASGIGDGDNAQFDVAGALLKTKASFDFETKASLSVRIRVDDGKGGSAEKQVTITVSNVNEAPTGLALSNATVAESRPSGTTVGTLSAADVDTADTLTFSLVAGTGDDDNALFEVSGSTLRTAAVLDFEQQATRSVRVRVSDGNGGTLELAFSITITDGLDPTFVTTSGGSLAYTEGDPATAVDSGLTLSDQDDTDLESATVSLVTGFEPDDELLFTNQNGITGSYNSGTGVLTLTGTSSLANYQAALRSIQFRNTGDNPAVSKAVQFIANDGDADSAPAIRTIAVTRVNDAPTVDTSDTALAYPEGSGPLAADAGVTVTDPDSTQIQGATVQITSNFVAVQDELAFSSQLGITGSYNDATGTLTLSGSASLASYQAALRAVTYENSSDSPAPATRTLAFLATDAEGDPSAAATRDITLGPANDAATVTTTGSALAYTEGDSATVVDTGLTVADPDDTNLEGARVRVSAGFQFDDELLFSDQNGITGSWSSGTGVLTLTGTSSVANYQTALRSVQFRHNGDDPSSVKTIEFRADDGDGLGPASTRNITLTPVNDKPVLTAGGTLNYSEGDPATAIDTSLTGTDADSASLQQATAQITAGYDSPDDVLSLPAGHGTISGSFSGATGTLTLTSTGPESPATWQAALRDVRYANGDADDPSSADRTITWIAGDGSDTSDAVTSTIDFTAINDKPVVASTSTGAVDFTEGLGAVTVDDLITVTDVDDTQMTGGSIAVRTPQTGDVVVLGDDPGDSITVTGSNTATVTLSGADTKAAYQAALRAAQYYNARTDLTDGTRQIDFVVNDGDDDSDTYTRTIDVTATNSAPVLVSSAGNAAFTESGGPVDVDSLITITDDGTNLTSAAISVAGPETGDVLTLADDGGDSITVAGSGTATITLTGTDSLAAYEAALRDVQFDNTRQDLTTGTRSVSFVVHDESLDSNTHTRTVDVTAVNDAPVVDTGAGAPSWTEPASGLAPVTVAPNLTVADADSLSLGGATATITPATVVTGDLLLWSDNNGFDSITATGSGTATVTFTGSGSASEYAAALAAVQFAQGTDDPTTATRTVSFRATDDGAVQSADTAASRKDVTVTPVNDAPVVNLDAAGALGYPEQNGYTNLFGAAATITDPDNATLDSLTVTVTSGFDATFDDVRLDPAVTGFSANFTGGSLTLTRAGGTVAQFQDALRNIQFRNTDDDPDDRNDGTPDAGVNERTVEVVADDGPDTSSPVSRDVTITPVNDAPSAPTTPPTVSSIRNTTLVAGTNSVTDPKVTRAVDFKSGSVDPDGLESAIVVQAVSDAATANAGRITLTAAGDLRYEPPASVTLTSDSYGYELSDGTTSSPTTTFTVNLAGEVWYVADQAPAPRDGTAARPFDTLAGALAVATTNDAIHIRRAPGDGTLTGGVTLQSGQKLIGEGVALTNTDVGTGTVETLFAAGTKPVLTASGVDVVTLAANTQVAGISINPDGAANGVSGAGASGVSLRSMDVSDTGTAASQPGIELTSTGNGLTLSGNVDVSMQSNRAISINGTVLSGAFTNVSTTASGNGSVSLTNTTGSLTFQDLALTTTASSAAAFLLNNATNIDIDGASFTTTISANGGPAVDASGLTNGSDLVFDSVGASGTPTKGVNLDGTGGWTFSAGAASTIGATSQVGFDVNGGSGAVSYAGSIANGTGRPVDVTGRSANTTISGDITGAGGTGINVSGNTAGTTTFSGATKTLSTGASQAVTLSSNAGHTINFTGGGLNVDTTTGIGLGASGGGTLSVTGAGNTIDSVGGTALSVASTTIGGSGLTFQSVSADGGSRGILLDGTGAGGLTVTGNTSGQCGGSVNSASHPFVVTAAVSADCSGGTIQNMTGSDDSSSTPVGTGIVLKDAQNVSLTRMRIRAHSNYAIRGTNVTGFTLSNVLIDGTNGSNSGSPFNDASVAFSDLKGSASVTSTSIGGGWADNFRVLNSTNVALSRITFTGVNIGANNNPNGNDAVLLETLPAASGALEATVTGSVFTSAAGDLLQYNHTGTGTGDLVLTNNEFSNNHAAIATGGGGLSLFTNPSGGATTMSVTNNTFRDAVGPGVLIVKPTGPTTLTGTFANNSIGVSGVANSGSKEGSALKLQTAGQGTLTWSVTGNSIFGYNNNGIEVLAGGGATLQSGAVNTTITANTIAEPGNTVGTESIPKNGIHFNIGTVPGDTYSACAVIGGAGALSNTIFASGKDGIPPTVGDIDFRLRQRQATTIRLPGYGGANTDNTAVTNFVAANNNLGGTPTGLVSNTVPTGGGYSGTGTTCP